MSAAVNMNYGTEISVKHENSEQMRVVSPHLRSNEHLMETDFLSDVIAPTSSNNNKVAETEVLFPVPNSLKSNPVKHRSFGTRSISHTTTPHVIDHRGQYTVPFKRSYSVPNRGVSRRTKHSTKVLRTYDETKPSNQSVRYRRENPGSMVHDRRNGTLTDPSSITHLHRQTIQTNGQVEHIRTISSNKQMKLNVDTNYNVPISPHTSPPLDGGVCRPRISKVPEVHTMYIRPQSTTNGLPPTGVRRPPVITPIPVGVESNRSVNPLQLSLEELRKDEKTGELLSPTGPPVEMFNTRIDDETGLPVKSTLRKQTFSDMGNNVMLTETKEEIQHGDLIETRVINKTSRQRSKEPLTDPFSRKLLHTQKSLNEYSKYANQEQIHASPQRATSHNYLPGRGNFENKQWVSEASLGRHHRLPTQGGGYSARRQNEQRMNERRLGNTSRSNRYTDNTNNRYGGASVSDFLEDISLEPIGAGVHDLDNPHGSIARSQRANTPTGSRTPGFDNTDAFRTAGTSHMHHQVHQYSGAPSPITQQNSFQEQSSFRGTDQHFRGSLQSVPHARASTVPPNYVGGVSGASGFGNLTDRERELMERVKATYRDWYLPQKQRIEVENMLRDKEPGSFIIRNSLSRVDSFAMAIKSPDDFSNTSRTSDYSNSGPVKHFIISTVSSSDGRNDGVQLLGFDNQAIFPNLVSFVFHHCVHPRAFPCTLRLPTTSNRQPIRDYGSLDRHRSKMSNGGAGDVGIRADMVYLGNQYVDRLEGDAAIRQAVTHVISKANENSQGLPDRSDVVVDVTPQSGIRISGRCRQGMVDHNLQPHKILYSAVDPECRIYVDQGLRNRQMYHAKLFGIVVRSKNLLMHGKKVHVFAEIDPNQSAHTLIQYINNIFRR